MADLDSRRPRAFVRWPRSSISPAPRINCTWPSRRSLGEDADDGDDPCEGEVGAIVDLAYRRDRWASEEAEAALVPGREGRAQVLDGEALRLRRCGCRHHPGTRGEQRAFADSGQVALY